MLSEKFPESLYGRVARCGFGMSYDAMVRLIEKLDAAIEGSGLKQADLSRKTGISTGALSEILSGKRKPRFEHIARLAKALGVSLDYLANDDLGEAPAPLGDPEKWAVEFIQVKELTKREVIRRLTNEPAPEAVDAPTKPRPRAAGVATPKARGATKKGGA